MTAWRCAAALAALGLAGLSVPASAQAVGDAARGKTVFARCAGCHTLTGPPLAGPNLKGVVGRKAGTGAGFKYSKALTASGLVWGDQTLDRFLTNPATAVPGTSMFLTVPSAQDRADVIAYLKTLTAPP